MSLIKPEPTADTVKALKAGLASFLDRSDPLLRILTGEQPGNREALRVYAVKLEDVATGNWREPQPIGWRFLAVDRFGNGIVVNVTEPTTSQPPRVAGVQRGPHVVTTIQALRSIQMQPGAPDAELSFMNIPGLYTETFWIKPKNAEGWTVPYHTLIKDLEKKPYTLEEFFTMLKPVAERRLREDPHTGT